MIQTTLKCAALIVCISLFVSAVNLVRAARLKRYRKRFIQDRRSPEKNICFENEVTILFDKAECNLVDRRDGIYISKKLEAPEAYSTIVRALNKAISRFVYNAKHPLYWLTLPGKMVPHLPQWASFLFNIASWFAGYLLALYLDISQYGQKILSYLLGLLNL